MAGKIITGTFAVPVSIRVEDDNATPTADFIRNYFDSTDERIFVRGFVDDDAPILLHDDEATLTVNAIRNATDDDLI